MGPSGPSGVSPFSLNGIDAYYTNGFLGIGTTGPIAPLHVENLGSTIFGKILNLRTTTGSDGTKISLQQSSAGVPWTTSMIQGTGQGTNGGSLSFYTNTGGTTDSTLTEKLKIDKDGKIYMNSITNTTKSDILYYDSGTKEITYGASTLSSADLFIGDVNTVIGKNTGGKTLATSTSTKNTIMGQQAGAAITATSASSRNTYMGVNAGQTATGSLNTFIGNLAGIDCITGNNNIVLGCHRGFPSGSNYNICISTTDDTTFILPQSTRAFYINKQLNNRTDTGFLPLKYNPSTGEIRCDM
jgi:hypothetical protein